MTISGRAGRTPVIRVYRQGAWGFEIPPNQSSAGRLAAYATHSPLAVATSRPPSDENAWVYPSTRSRRLGSGKSAASHATAATNSTDKPTNTKHRNTNSIPIDVEKPERNAPIA